MESTTLVQLLQLTQGSQWLAPGLLLFVAIPLAIGSLKSVLTFHNEFILHRRIRNLDSALGALPTSDAAYDLLVECRAQEAMQVNIGVRLSSMERAVVLQWVRTSPVTLDLIRRAWPQVSWENNVLFPRLSGVDRFYMWYCVGALLFMMIASVILAVLAFHAAVFDGQWRLLSLPVLTIGLAWLLVKQAGPGLSARRLQYRLQKFGWSAEAPKE